MVTGKIKIKPYLAEFLRSYYKSNPVQFPLNSDILAFIHELRIKMPGQLKEEPEYNLEFIIPYQKYGKDPRQHHYFPAAAQRVLQNKINTLFTAIFNDYIASKVHILGVEYKDAIYMFIDDFKLESISFEGLKQKNYRDRSGKRYRRENKFKELNIIKSE